MNDFLVSSSFFGAALTLVAYFIGDYIKEKTGKRIFNPILIGIIIVMVVLRIFNIDYRVYNASAGYISWFLTPVTVSLAIPLYRQLRVLRTNVKAIVMGITCGVIASGLGILGLSVLFGLSHRQYVTLLPKSITSAIGMVVSEELGGYPSITVPVIIITGIYGNIIREAAMKFFRITDPVAKGLAIGTASHATGTSKAMELGPVEGAMSGLSIAVAGLITVVAAQLFARLY